MKTYVLYNKKSDNKAGKNEAEQLRKNWKNRQLEFVDAVSLEREAEMISGTTSEKRRATLPRQLISTLKTFPLLP